MDLEYNEGILFMRLKGNLESKSTFKVSNYLIPTLLKHKIKYLVCNLNELNDLDEVGLYALLNTKWAMKINKGKIYLCDVPERLVDKTKKLKIRVLSDELSAKRLIEV